MRINSIPPKDLYCQYIYMRDKAVPQTKNTTEPDKVELSTEAKSFSAALKAAKESIEKQSAFEANRVEEIKQQIADHTYSVPGHKVAQKMLGE
ncbi:MAG: flagellar biosynthesis anti-sigma factor FlgM [Christensenellales bacterium]